MVVKSEKKQESCWAAKLAQLKVHREAAWWVAKMVQHWADM